MELNDLSIIQFILDLSTILSYSNVLLTHRTLIYVGQNIVLLLIVVRKLVNKIVDVFSYVACLHVLFGTHVAVNYNWMHLVVGLVVAVVRNQISTRILLESL